MDLAHKSVDLRFVRLICKKLEVSRLFQIFFTVLQVQIGPLLTELLKLKKPLGPVCRQQDVMP